jgi:hypothetical protein
MDITTLWDPVEMAVMEAQAVPSATEAKEGMVEAGLAQDLVWLLPAVLAVPGVPEVPPVATAELEAQAAMGLPMGLMRPESAV